MSKKVCYVCRDEKDSSLFGRNKSTPDGLRKECKECRNSNRKSTRKSSIICACCSAEIIGEFTQRKKYCSKECQNKQNSRNQRKKVAYTIWKKKNRLKLREQRMKCRKNNYYSLSNINWRKEYEQKPETKIRRALRARVRKMIKKEQASVKTIKLLGCSIDFLKKYLETKFEQGMSWDNYGQFGWHIDHIKPLSLAQSQEELDSLCHYSNLQPLWWRDNISKSNKYV